MGIQLIQTLDDKSVSEDQKKKARLLYDPEKRKKKTKISSLSLTLQLHYYSMSFQVKWFS